MSTDRSALLDQVIDNYEYSEDELMALLDDANAMNDIARSALKTLQAALKDIRAAELRALDIAKVALCESERAILYLETAKKAFMAAEKRQNERATQGANFAPELRPNNKTA